MGTRKRRNTPLIASSEPATPTMSWSTISISVAVGRPVTISTCGVSGSQSSSMTVPGWSGSKVLTIRSGMPACRMPLAARGWIASMPMLES